MAEENSTGESLENKAAELLRLHQDPTLLTVVNVWDSISTKVVADTPGTSAIATASHSIAASLGYPDGEKIPVDLMIEAVGRIVDATTLPVTADLEGGYGDPVETVRKAIGVGVVGANIEDQMKSVDEAATNVQAIMDAAISEGVPSFVLNARTDAFAKGRDRDPDEVLADAIARGKAYLEAGAPLVFVPGLLNDEQISTLSKEFGPQKLTVIGFPGSVPLPRLEELGVARISYGPQPMRVALTALQKLVEEIHSGGGVPADTRQKLT